MAGPTGATASNRSPIAERTTSSSPRRRPRSKRKTPARRHSSSRLPGCSNAQTSLPKTKVIAPPRSDERPAAKILCPRHRGGPMMRSSDRSASGFIPMSDIQHYIDGKRVDGTNGRSGDVYNPATGERTGRVAFASPDEVDRAVKAAGAAFPAWAATPPLTRARILFKFRELLDREAGALARLIS